MLPKKLLTLHKLHYQLHILAQQNTAGKQKREKWGAGRTNARKWVPYQILVCTNK
jgi:hypothetical protein